MRLLPIVVALSSGCIYDRAAMRPERGRPAGLAASDLVPTGAQFVVYSDVGRVRGTAVARTLVRLGSQDDEILPTLRRAGVEPMRDFERVLAAGRFEEDAWRVLLEHRMNRDRTRQFIDAIFTLEGETAVHEVIGGHEVYSCPRDAIVVVHESLLAVVPRSGLPVLLGDLDAGHGDRAGLAARFRRALDQPRTEHPPFFVGIAETPPELPELDDEGIPELPPPSTIAAWAALGPGLEVEIEGHYPEAATAARVGESIRVAMDLEGRLRAYASVAGMEPLFSGARVSVHGNRLSLRIEVSQRDLEGMLARAELMAEE